MEIQRSALLLAQSTFDVGTFAAIVVLIMCSAFISMSETAITSSSLVKLRLAVDDRRAGAKKAIQLSEQYDKTITTILVGNNVVNTAASTLAVGFFTKLGIDGRILELVSTLIVTVVLLIFGEIMPKTIGKQYSEKIALKIAWPIYIISCILWPIVMFFRLLQKAFTRKKVDDAMNEDELEIALNNMEKDGKIENKEVGLIKNVLNLNDRSVLDIMLPRIEMVAVEYDSTLGEVKKLLLESSYSRIPVYKGDKDHIVGILYERDFFKTYSNKENYDWHKIIKPAKYVSAAMKVDSLIAYLQKEKTHLAIVSGELGDTLGLVTMEDALEELVGEIYDEHDEAGSDDLYFKQESENTYIVDGDFYVEDLFDKLNIGQAPEDIPNKLYSWMFEYCEEIPKVGIQMTYVSRFTKYDDEEDSFVDYAKKITFTIFEVEGRRIEKVKVEIADATEEEIEEQIREDEEE